MTRLITYTLSLSIIVVISYSCSSFSTKAYDDQRDINRFLGIFGEEIWEGVPTKTSKYISVLVAYNPPVLKHNMNYFGIFIEEKMSSTTKVEMNLMHFDNPWVGNLKEYNLTWIGLKDPDFQSDEIVSDYLVPDIAEKYSPIKGLIDTAKGKIVVQEIIPCSMIPCEYFDEDNSLELQGVSKGVFINQELDSRIYWVIGW